MDDKTNNKRQPSTNRLANARKRLPEGLGMAPLPIVEHSLCPIDPKAGLKRGLVHDANYFYTDADGNRRKGNASVFAAHGLSPSDEFYLHGMLALTFSDEHPVAEFRATPHEILRKLDVIKNKRAKGGRTYSDFRAAIRRIGSVVYQNSCYFDPIRGEHREVSFGLLDYSLPLDDESQRSWRFVWNTMFFEFCQNVQGAFSFDWPTYLQLSHAQRRLYLLVKKIFYRHKRPIVFDLDHLTVDVLGFSKDRPTYKRKADLAAILNVLIDRQLLALPKGCDSPKTSIKRKSKGVFQVTLRAGSRLHKTTDRHSNFTIQSSSLYQQITSLGIDNSDAISIIRRYKKSLLEEWIDITLAKRERQGERSFTKSAAAYFIDNVSQIAKGTRTSEPPDWWLDIRREERRKSEQEAAEKNSVLARFAKAKSPSFEEYLQDEGLEQFEKIVKESIQQLIQAGQSGAEARDNGISMARQRMQIRFHERHPDRQRGPTRLGDLFDLN